MFGSIKKYCIITSIFFSVSSFAKPISGAEITSDIVIHAMLSYLNDISEERVETLKSQYDSHSSQFKENREKEIEVKRKEKLAELNHFSTILEERRVQLNREIALYNTMLVQAEAKMEEENNLRDKLNQAIQRLNAVNNLKDQVVSLVAELNKEIRAVNQNVFTLDTLQKAEQASLHYYENKGYLSDESIAQLRENLRQWITSTNENLDSKIVSYNSKVAEFQQWQQGQQEAIEAQRAHVNLKMEELNQFNEEINIIVAEYNQIRETRCKTKECAENILNKKNQIEEKKEESAQRQTTIDQLVSDLIQKETNYNTEHANRVAELTGLIEEMDQFSQNLSAERSLKEQELEERIQAKDGEAKKQWEKDKAALDQFQASLNTGYGGHFDQFVGYLYHWALINATRFEELETLSQEEMDQLQAANQNLCEYSHTYPSAMKSKQVCGFVTQVYTLLEEINNTHAGDPIESWREELNALSEEVATLQRQVEAKKLENDLKRSQLKTQGEEYKAQLPQREEQYRLFSATLTEELNTQLQQIYTVYQLKGDLLIKEYQLLFYILYQLEVEESDVFFSKRDGFLNALEAFMSNIPDQITGFPETFIQPNEIFSTILSQKDWDLGSYPDIPLSSTVNGGSGSVVRMENEDKKHIVFSWGNTSFISEFLMSLQSRFTGVLEVADKDVVIVDSDQMFFKMLFLKGVYHYTPVRQLRGRSLVRYYVTFNERAFWILPEGVLEAPKRVYR